MSHLLLVEDDSGLAGSLGDYLSEVGFSVDYASNGAACLELVLKNTYDAIVMDVTMPKLDGLATCRRLRDDLKNRTPVIFLTARDTLQDKLDGYKAGAEDYLVKPFAPEELVCRLDVILRRGKAEVQGKQALGELQIDHDLQIVLRQGVRIELPETLFRMFVLLANAAPLPVSRSVLESELWEDAPPGSDPLRTHIYRLRQALDAQFESPLLRTVHGKGYRLAIPD